MNKAHNDGINMTSYKDMLGVDLKVELTTGITPLIPLVKIISKTLQIPKLIH